MRRPLPLPLLAVVCATLLAGCVGSGAPPATGLMTITVEHVSGPAGDVRLLVGDTTAEEEIVNTTRTVAEGDVFTLDFPRDEAHAYNLFVLLDGTGDGVFRGVDAGACPDLDVEWSIELADGKLHAREAACAES